MRSVRKLQDEDRSVVNIESLFNGFTCYLTGFSDENYKPAKHTLALWLQFEGKEYRGHEFVAAGELLRVTFSFKRFFGAMGLDEDVEATADIDPTALKFRRGSSVTSWKTLEALFPGKLDFSKPVDLKEGPQILGRFRVYVDGSQKKAELSFEAIVLRKDEVFEGLKADLKQKLEKGGSKTFWLWKTSALLYGPAVERVALGTTPGLCLKDGGEPPADPVVRWVVNWVFDLARKRAYVKNADEWNKYLESPYMARGEKVGYGFVFSIASKPAVSKPEGEICGFVETLNYPANKITIRSGKRKGLVLDLNQRKKPKSMVLPIATAPSKFSTTAHPLLQLDRSALPPEVSAEVFDKAARNFSSSITHGTQIVYSTTARHVLGAEKILGRVFSCPPTDQEQLFFLTYLQNRRLKAETIKNYLSAFR